MVSVNGHLLDCVKQGSGCFRVCVALPGSVAPGGSTATSEREGDVWRMEQGKKAKQRWMPAGCRHARTNPFSLHRESGCGGGAGVGSSGKQAPVRPAVLVMDSHRGVGDVEEGVEMCRGHPEL